MDSASIIADWQRRLVALADNPDYVFRETPQQLIEQHYRRLTTFFGYSEEEIAASEERLKVRFPTVFRQYLLNMAKSPGDLLRGSNLAGVGDFERFRRDAVALLADTGPALEPPAAAVVFLFHQGYFFEYILADGGFDGPVMAWTETERAPSQVAATFAEMVDAELQLMENTNQDSRERGGYYKTLHPGGGASMIFPALNSAERPLDQARPDESQ